MKAVHIRTDGMHDENECAFCEMVVRLTEGVHDVASVRSLNLVSVLYDEGVTDDAQVLSTIRRAGFEARPYRMQPVSRDLVATGPLS